MSCRQVDLVHGVTAFACSRGSSRKVVCVYCKARECVYLCDYELRGKKAGQTCDGKLCASCATVDGENRHLCPPHRRERDAQLAKERDADAWLTELRGESQASDCPVKVTASQVAAVPRGDTTRGENMLRAPKRTDPDLDVDALAKMFPDWDPANGVAWFGDSDESPVSKIAGEIRSRHVELDDVVELPDGWGTVPKVEDPDAVTTLQVARENAVIISQQRDRAGARPCPRCGGHVVIVGNRAWCVRRYIDGGCGGYWTAANDDKTEAQKQIEGELRAAFGADESRAHRDRELRQRANVPIAEKVAHVRGARQSRGHGCHWPGCPEQVPPAMWGCRTHWMQLPRRIRDRIWHAYAPGQENTLSPSRDYLDAADEAQRWIKSHFASLGEVDAPPRRQSWDEVVRNTRERDAARGAPEIENKPATVRRRAEQLAMLDVATSNLREQRLDLAPGGDVAQDLATRGEHEDDVKSDAEPRMPWDEDF